MRLGATLSVGLHAVAIAVAWFGLPHLRSEPPVLDDIVFVKLADLGDVANVPPETREPIQKKPKPKPERPKSKPKLPPPVRTAATPPLAPPPAPAPKPVSKPAPEPESAVAVVPEKPAPKSAPRPKPKPTAAMPKPLPRPKLRPVKSTPEPARPKKMAEPKQPTPERKFSSLLKNLKKESPKMKAPVKKKKSLVERAREAARNQSMRKFDPNAAVTVNEIQAVRQQLAQCWNVAAGARRADALSVEIEMVMNPDATVRQARIADSTRMNTDPYYRAAAESALRALGHPDCMPLKLPLEKYEVWKNFTFNFDPSKMLQ